ncbi:MULTISPECIES: HAMP domain-containing sensor histidine kinase [unclassified Gordonia (in: high G+C Gram-positive bacteria)]|uniref:sensor histidine kinase n=1 Tax=Gordonia TaxID=2053 RepID=UPI00071D89B1|nr:MULTISPECIES: HAMP domain-containing sensor histidine kinase [unclassified Gordonia (in: high G+C Gram-positive bacteria)]MCX2753849.1 HAMP domain-containing sensor histidine kinase [Gordonia sp. 4N]MDT0220918.1 HAMP domain-containing sensor histidine kinase [Gordonia sp. AC31]
MRAPGVTLAVPDRRRRFRAASVRMRLTVVGAAMLFTALLIAGAIVLFVLYHSLNTAADGATAARSGEIVDAMSRSGVAGLDPSLLERTEAVDIVQIVGRNGDVLAATPGVEQDRALVPPAGRAGMSHVIDAAFPGSDTEYRATVQGAEVSGDLVTVVVGAGEGSIHATVWTVFAVLCVVFPIILAAAVIATDQLLRRALRPVESIRAEVADISRAGVARRVPVPDTGDEIATLAETMNEMLDRLAFARDQQLRFVGDSSHELRSPLVTIIGLLELADRTGEPIDDDSVSTLLLPEAYRLRDLIDDLLLLARADEYGLRPEFEDVDLDDIVNDEVTRLDLTTELDVDATVLPVRVTGDRRQLARALRNLGDNATRHAHGAVSVTMAVGPERVAVTVADDGVGVPDEDRDRIFDRFVRLDTARERGGGTGLGLSIVAEIVHAHGGTVAVADTGGDGFAIELSLPRTTPHDSGPPPSPARR